MTGRKTTHGFRSGDLERTRPSRRWTAFEIDTFLALVSRGAHRVSRAQDKSIAMLHLTEQLNGAVHTPRAADDSHPDDRDTDEVARLFRLVRDEKKAALAFLDRSFPSRLTRTKRRVFERNIGFLGDADEWEARKDREKARQHEAYEQFVLRRERDRAGQAVLAELYDGGLRREGRAISKGVPELTGAPLADTPSGFRPDSTTDSGAGGARCAPRRFRAARDIGISRGGWSGGFVEPGSEVRTVTGSTSARLPDPEAPKHLTAAPWTSGRNVGLQGPSLSAAHESGELGDSTLSASLVDAGSLLTGQIQEPSRPSGPSPPSSPDGPAGIADSIRRSQPGFGPVRAPRSPVQGHVEAAVADAPLPNDVTDDTPLGALSAYPRTGTAARKPRTPKHGLAPHPTP